MNSLSQSFNSETLTRIGRSAILSSKFAKLISWLLLLLIIYMLSVLSWSLWEFFQPRQAIAISPKPASSTEQPSPKFNISQLVAINLFGDANVVPTTPATNEIDAPVTRLKLKLRGVYAAEDETLAGAMIEAQNKQEVYRVGNKLPGATGLKLYKIMADRVILSRNGKFETLMIEDFGHAAGTIRIGNSSSRTEVIDTS